MEQRSTQQHRIFVRERPFATWLASSVRASLAVTTLVCFVAIDLKIGENAQPAAISYHRVDLPRVSLKYQSREVSARDVSAQIVNATVIVRADSVAFHRIGSMPEEKEEPHYSLLPFRRAIKLVADRLESTAVRVLSRLPIEFQVTQPIDLGKGGQLERPTLRRVSGRNYLSGHIWRELSQQQLSFDLREIELVRIRPMLGEGIIIRLPATQERPALTVHTKSSGDEQLEFEITETNGPGRIAAAADLKFLSLRLRASDFPVDPLRMMTMEIVGDTRWRALLTRSTELAPRLGRLTGSFFVAKNGDGSVDVSSEQLSLGPISFRHAKLASTAIELDPISLQGNFKHSQGTIKVEVELEHKRAHVFLSGILSNSEASLQLSLPVQPCTQLFTSLPTAFTDKLGGLSLRGSLGGTINASVNIEGLAAFARAEIKRPGSGNLPALVEGFLPMMSACKVGTPPSLADLAALDHGDYYHHFRDGSKDREIWLSPRNPKFTRLSDSGWLAKTFILLEDSNFWEHRGIDGEQLMRAIWLNLGAGAFVRGASTLSQQTARMLWLGMERTLARKFQEAVLAQVLESHLSKAEILEIYLNVVELGDGIYGIGDASRAYFGKRPAELSPWEAVLIAGLAPSPKRYAKLLTAQDADWMRTMEVQLGRMVQHGWISSAVAKRAKHQLRTAKPR